MSATYFSGVVAGRWDELHPFLRDRLTGPEPTPEDGLRVEDELKTLNNELGAFFSEYDLLLCPTAPEPAHERVLEAGAALEAARGSRQLPQ